MCLDEISKEALNDTKIDAPKITGGDDLLFKFDKEFLSSVHEIIRRFMLC